MGLGWGPGCVALGWTALGWMGPGGCGWWARLVLAMTRSPSWPANCPAARLVVTADRELRGRCEAAGALVTGPRWLTERLDG